MVALIVRAQAGAVLVGSALFALLLSSTAHAAPIQVPDVIVYDVGVDGSNTNDIHYWGQSSGIAAYSIATQSCNAGTEQVDWFTSGGSTLHPVIGQNMFRLKNGRFEQIGQSWLKHGFCAVNEFETFCGPCQSTPCSTLGIGCADTYWATLNDGGGGQSKRNVNAANGTHVHGGGPSGVITTRGRLQVAVADIDPAQNPGAQWFIEGQYVTADDAQAGVGDNNASWRRVNVLSVSNVDGGGPTHREEPAIYAWQSVDPTVEIQVANNIESSGIKTSYLLGCKVTALGGARWRYEYALQNLDSDQSAGSFSVPVDPDAVINHIGFKDVKYHSGDPYDGTDWPGIKNGGEVRWATTPFGTNVNANALRWGTLYNFRFIANSAPVHGPVTIGLFKPDVNTDITVTDVWVPSDAPPVKAPHLFKPPVSPLLGGGPRGGSHGNPVILVEHSTASIGGTWQAGIELDQAVESLLFVSFAGAAEGSLNHMGELLIQPVSSMPSSSLALTIPDDPHLVGLTFSAQAAVRTAGGWRLTNALDVTIGDAK